MAIQVVVFSFSSFRFLWCPFYSVRGTEFTCMTMIYSNPLIWSLISVLLKHNVWKQICEECCKTRILCQRLSYLLECLREKDHASILGWCRLQVTCLFPHFEITFVPNHCSTFSFFLTLQVICWQDFRVCFLRFC